MVRQWSRSESNSNRGGSWATRTRTCSGWRAASSRPMIAPELLPKTDAGSSRRRRRPTARGARRRHGPRSAGAPAPRPEGCASCRAGRTSPPCTGRRAARPDPCTRRRRRPRRRSAAGRAGAADLVVQVGAGHLQGVRLRGLHGRSSLGWSSATGSAGHRPVGAAGAFSTSLREISAEPPGETVGSGPPRTSGGPHAERTRSQITVQ